MYTIIFLERTICGHDAMVGSTSRPWAEQRNGIKWVAQKSLFLTVVINQMTSFQTYTYVPSRSNPYEI